jgi:hypothetical protein
MIGGLLAAHSSTILTHLNWGASYLVHDFYRRFVRRDADERHYVAAGRAVTAGLFVASAAAVYLLDTAKGAFDVILQIGAGTGLLYLVRWYWWRVTAWCEVVAMTSSLAVSVIILILNKNGAGISSHVALVSTVVATTACWLAAAYLGPETDRVVLAEFYRKVRPPGPGWAPIRAIARVEDAEPAGLTSLPIAMAGWAAGCAAIWSALFATGSILYGRWPQAWLLMAVFAASVVTLGWALRRMWPAEGT